jgi:hypothetical protein
MNKNIQKIRRLPVHDQTGRQSHKYINMTHAVPESRIRITNTAYIRNKKLPYIWVLRTLAALPSMTATQEFVVPRSTPMTAPFTPTNKIKRYFTCPILIFAKSLKPKFQIAGFHTNSNSNFKIIYKVPVPHYQSS